MRVGIITVSDRCSRQECVDESGKRIMDILSERNEEIAFYCTLPDERTLVSNVLLQRCEESICDLILTTGGTGFSPRDVTPEATLDIIERHVPGIPEEMRRVSMQKTPNAMLSRAVAGIRGRTLIVNLPGSVKAVTECLEAILPALSHGIEVLRGEVGSCGR